VGPKLVTELSARLTQTLKITPQLQQALKLLQLPALELSTLVRQELSENPLLEENEKGEQAVEIESPDVPEESPEAGERTSEVAVNDDGLTPEGFDKEEWENYFSDDGYEVPRYDREGMNEYTEPQIAKQPTLEEHLLWQLRLVCTSEEEYRIGELIVGNLDDRGFFTMGLAELAQTADADEDAVADVLALIQGLDPVGVGARDVKESLLIQLRHLPERQPLAETIVEKHFETLERHQLDAIARAEKVAREQVAAAAHVIASLDPYPGRHQAEGTVEYVVPDVVVEKHDDQYIIIINDETVPELKISQTYRRLLRRGSEITEETRNYLNDRLQRAIWLIRSIDQRRKTLYKVVETIVDVQLDFFEKGVEFLKPLTLREIAERVSLHESTISRVTSRKYMQTPRGLFELKYFFSSHIQTTDGKEISSTSVKAILQELIQQENSAKPLSDQRLTELLEEKGFKIARRTVAKYREELNVLPASRRKRLE